MREEDHFFDKKAASVSGKKIQKIAVALANADGGEVAVGIADAKEEPDPIKRWAGASTIEDLNSHLQALTEVRPGLPMEAQLLKTAAYPGYVLLIRVEKSPALHSTADGTVYVRLGAQSLPVSDPQRVMELQYAKGATSFEDQVLPELRTEEIADASELGRFLADYSPRTDPLEFAANQNLIDRVTWQPRVAGLLLFNANPSALLPRKCGLKVARYETKEDDPEREHLKDIKTLEGPLYPLIRDAIKTTTEIMSSIKIWTTSGLRTMQYPPEAIWEVVVNAVIHRDYSISDDIQILIFNNRIEVISPGRLPGYVTPENILDARYSRNSKIVRTLARYKDAPNKDLGEGLNTAYQRMKDWRLRSPEILEEGNYVRVVIPHAPLATPSEAILEFLKTSPNITNRQAREITGIRSENSMKSEFYKLRDEGLLEMIPELKGAAAAWRLTAAAAQTHLDAPLAANSSQLPLIVTAEDPSNPQ